MFLKIVSPFYLIISFKLVCDGVLHGSACVKAFMASTFTDLTLKAVLAWLFPMILLWGITGIWLAWPVGWSTATIISCIAYYKGYWKNSGFTK